MKKNVIIIAPHADDETLGCGGVILKHINNGDNVYWIIVTSNNDKLIFPNQDNQHYENNIAKVSSAYKFNETIRLNFPVARLDTIDEHIIYDTFAEKINNLQPQIIYMPYFHDVHADHKIISRLMLSCTKNFRFPFIEKIYIYETISETDFGPSIPSFTFSPNKFVDITKYMNRKLEIMEMYDTEIMKDPLPRSLHAIKALAALRGSRIGVSYAEAFMILFERE
tara:strand:- start:7070 stop:7741 length:672 start_codon:yes stop_codon:yes gene_type:complete